MRKGLALSILAMLTLVLFSANTTMAVDPDVSVQPQLVQDNQMKPSEPPLESHPTAHQYNAPVTDPADAYDNNQITYSSTNISQQPYPSVYSCPASYFGNATPPTNPAYAYDLNNASFAALDIVKTKVGGNYYPYLREFNVTTFNTTVVTAISSIDIHIKYNLNLTEWGIPRKVWYGFMLYVGTKKTELQTLTETQINVTTTIGNWTAVPEPNDGLWSKADLGNIVIGIQTKPNRTEDVGIFRAFEVWARVYSPVVQYFEVRTFNPTEISSYSYLSVNINCTIIVGGCSYKILISVGSKNTTVQDWNDVSQLDPSTITWESVTEPNDGWWDQTNLANLRIIIETQKTKSVNIGEFRIYEAWVSISPPTVNSYPSNHGGTATVSNPTLAYDKNQMTYASITPPGTTFTYFAVQSFNVTTLKEYATVNIQMKYNVTTWNARYGIYLQVGGKSLYLQKQTNANQTEPMVRTWVGVCEPNDAVWSPADISNMEIRVEVRKTTTAGTCTFREYDTWVTIPDGHLTIRAHVLGVQVSAPLYAWQFNLSFNPAVLQVVIVSEGPFLKQVPLGKTTFAGSTMNNTAGWLSTACGVDDWFSGGVDGSGTIATITFQAIAKGNSMFNFTRTELVGFDEGSELPVPLAHTRSPGWFQYLAGDVNGDAIVNITDLYKLGEAYGTTSGSPGYNADADQDKDGDVDGNDLTVVSANYGAT